MSEKPLSEQLFDLASDCLDDPLRIIGGKIAQLEAELDAFYILDEMGHIGVVLENIHLETDKQMLMEFINCVRKNDYWEEWNKLPDRLHKEIEEVNDPNASS